MACNLLSDGLQDIQSLSRDCCAAAAALHAEDVVMRDFRLPNVLTRNGVEGDYVVVDMEYAGPDCTEWSLDLLDKWDAETLNEVSVRAASCYSKQLQTLLHAPFPMSTITLRFRWAEVFVSTNRWWLTNADASV